MNQKSKPVILLNWGYHRQGWIEVFEALKDQFNFHYIYWISKEEEVANLTNCPVHYWSDFASPKEILKLIQPAKVIFLGSNSLLSIGLLFECVKKKIPTYTLQHGVFHDLKTNLYLDEQMMKNALPQDSVAKTVRHKNINSLSFFLKSLSFKTLPCIVPLAKWQYDKRKMLPLAAWVKNIHSCRRTDYYIVFTKFNGRFFTESDGATENQMIEIGVPEFDKFFLAAQTISNAKEITSPYNLLIDSALTYNAELQTNGVVDQSHYNAFLSQLNEVSLRQGRKLYVKLHPYCYKNAKFVKDDNITYFKDCDIVDVILNAEAVLGFDSTLILPSVYYKPTILFTLHDFAYLQTNLSKLNAAPVLDYFNFSEQDLQEAFRFRLSESARQAFVQQFIYKADGRTQARLAEILMN